MADISNIPTPLKLQFKRVRYQVLPILVFTISLVTVAILWSRHGTVGTAVGEVTALTVKVSSPLDGKIIQPSGGFPKLFSTISENQVMVSLDMSKLDVEYNKVRDQLMVVRAQLTTNTNKLDDPANAANKVLRDDLRSANTSLAEQIRQLESDERRLNADIQQSSIKSPISGTITAVRHQANEYVKKGEEIFTVTPYTGAYIVTYIRPSMPMPKKDQQVVVRGPDKKYVATSVEEVGTGIEFIPDSQLSNPRRQERGVPVRIKMPEGTTLKPGEMVSLMFKTTAEQ